MLYAGMKYQQAADMASAGAYRIPIGATAKMSARPAEAPGAHMPSVASGEIELITLAPGTSSAHAVEAFVDRRMCHKNSDCLCQDFDGAQFRPSYSGECFVQIGRCRACTLE